MMLRDAVGVSHRRVVLVEAPDAVHFVMDAAGDVLNVLHVGPDGMETRELKTCSKLKKDQTNVETRCSWITTLHRVAFIDLSIK